MTRLNKVSKSLAEIKDKLPPYCVIRKRKRYEVVYFSVPEKSRPEGWQAIFEVGRTDRHSVKQIIDRGNEYYEALKASRRSHQLQEIKALKGSLSWLIERYKKSEHYTNLKPATQAGYLHYLATVRKWSEASGNAHIKLLTTPVIVEFLNRWRHTPRTRKYYKAILSKLYQVAVDEGVSEKNPLKEIKLPKSNKKKLKFKVWNAEKIDLFARTADKMNLFNTGTAVIVAWEAFRQTDVFELQAPRDYKNGAFCFETSKTGEPIRILASQRTVKRLNQRPATQLLLTVNDITGMVWTKNSFYNQFKKVCKECGLKGYVFRRIRNSSAIHALKAGLTPAEFQQRYGWSIKDVEAMRDHYTDIDQDIIDSGAAKLAKHEKS